MSTLSPPPVSEPVQSRKDVTVLIEDTPYHYTVEGSVGYGPDVLLLDEQDNLIAKTAWADIGYTIEPFITPTQYDALVEQITAMVKGRLAELGFAVTPGFTLETYHQTIAECPEIHTDVVRWIQQGFAVSTLPFDKQVIVDRISELCGLPLSFYNPKLGEIFYIRLIRPQRSDHNPPHRDPWIDTLRNAVNIYVPIAGSTRESSLAIIPGSHYWKESEVERTLAGSTVSGSQYNVSAVTDAKFPLSMIRPNPAPNEVLVFSPYTLHGAGVNFSPDTTRVSIEMRFWRQQPAV